MSVLVFGSLNLDLVARTPRLPMPGETLTGYSFDTIPGGKGANQAVAAARLGVATRMIGRVGGDRFGQTLLQSLQSDGVNCDGVAIDDSIHSGVALITVDDASENQIIVIPGANGQVGEVEVGRLRSVLADAKVLLLQLEVPLAAIVGAAEAAKQAGVTVILDPAPARSDLPNELYRAIDILTPNEVEASQLVEFAIDTEAEVMRAGEILHRRGVQTVVIKRGKRGAWVQTAEEAYAIEAFPVEAVDTVAAGDAFNGGLAAGLANNLSLKAALRQAAAVAALSVTQAGAQPSMPVREVVEGFLGGR